MGLPPPEQPETQEGSKEKERAAGGEGMLPLGFLERYTHHREDEKREEREGRERIETEGDRT